MKLKGTIKSVLREHPDRKQDPSPNFLIFWWLEVATSHITLIPKQRETILFRDHQKKWNDEQRKHQRSANKQWHRGFWEATCNMRKYIFLVYWSRRKYLQPAWSDAVCLTLKMSLLVENFSFVFCFTKSVCAKSCDHTSHTPPLKK